MKFFNGVFLVGLLSALAIFGAVVATEVGSELNVEPTSGKSSEGADETARRHSNGFLHESEAVSDADASEEAREPKQFFQPRGNFASWINPNLAPVHAAPATPLVGNHQALYGAAFRNGVLPATRRAASELYSLQQLSNLYRYQQQQAYLHALLTAKANPYSSLFRGNSIGYAPQPVAASPYAYAQIPAPSSVSPGQQTTPAFVLIPETLEEYVFLSQLSQLGGGYLDASAVAGNTAVTYADPVAASQPSSLAPSAAFGHGQQQQPSAGVPQRLVASPAEIQSRNSFWSGFVPAPAAVEGRLINNWNQLLPIFTFDQNTNSFTYSKPNIFSQFAPISARVTSFSDGADIAGRAATVSGQAFFFQEDWNKDVYTAVTLVGLDATAGLLYNVEIFSGSDVTTTLCAGTGSLYAVDGMSGVIASSQVPAAGAAGALSVVQRTPISAMQLHGTFASIGKSIVIRETTTGTRVACGVVTNL